MSRKFFELFKQRGVIETLQVLNLFPNFEVVQNIFHSKLKEMGSYYQAHLRVREDLVHRQLISFKLDHNYDRVICLTEKGQRLCQIICEMETRLDQNE